MSQERIKETAKQCLGLMEAAAITAPKALGQDSLNTVVLDDEQIELVGRTMIEFGNESGQENFIRDGKNILESHGMLLIGVKGHQPLGADCKACGYGCKDFHKTASGTFEGAAVDRELRFVLHGLHQPQRVALDDQETTWEWDEATSTAHVPAGTRPVTRGTVLTVTT